MRAGIEQGLKDVFCALRFVAGSWHGADAKCSKDRKK